VDVGTPLSERTCSSADPRKTRQAAEAFGLCQPGPLHIHERCILELLLAVGIVALVTERAGFTAFEVEAKLCFDFGTPERISS